MPGERPGRPSGMAQYLVALKDEHDTVPAGSRAAVYDAGLALTTRFRDHLRHLLEAKGVTDQVSRIGEPGGLPVLPITCTANVAKLIEALPEVEAVVRDSPDLEIIRP